MEGLRRVRGGEDARIVGRDVIIAKWRRETMSGSAKRIRKLIKGLLVYTIVKLYKQ